MFNKLLFNLIEDCVPKLLTALCSGSMTPREHLETQQANNYFKLFYFTARDRCSDINTCYDFRH